MKLFVGLNCSPCNMVKSWLANNNIQVEQILAVDHMDEATKYGIKSLPTLVLDDLTLIRGYEDIVEYFKKQKEEE